VEHEIEVLIADDHPIVRRGLRQVIEADAALKVVAEAGDGREVLERIEELRPRVAVLDLDMPGLDGFAVTREIQKRRLPVEVIILTIHSEADMFNEALDLGVKGYVVKDCAVSDIVAAIRAVASGQHYISPTLSAHLVKRRARADALAREKPTLAQLTPTERRVLRLIAEYKTSKEIAAELFIHYRTVENHRTNICQKLDIHGSHALLKFALQHRSEL
jgi:DNA-binding NarL/FixJ family response regulator